MPEYTKKFDFISIVFVNEDPFNKPFLLPYSNKVKEGYHIIIHGIQQILQDVVTNRKASIQRNKSIPPIPWRTAPFFSKEEIKKFEVILQKFDTKHPPKNTEFSINIIATEDYPWYSKLDDFLEECKKTKDMDTEFQKKT